MDGAATIQVLKRDGGAELFAREKLAGAMCRVMRGRGGTLQDATDLAEAIELQLGRRSPRVSSAAIFEMVVKVFRRVRLFAAAKAIEHHRAWRRSRRAKMRILHEEGTVTAWDKAWLAKLAESGWGVSATVARIIAGQIESEMLAADTLVITRAGALDILNARVAALGLADAVPVQQSTGPP